MSEYQWVEFRAIDAPLDDEQLEFMRSQSTRADVSRRKFTNEYNFGDFHGDACKMLRRGFDIHVHYANFGIRRLCFHFKDGFAYANEMQAYLLDDQILWLPDEQGSGGILTFEPEGDAGTWDWMDNLSDLTGDLIPLREMIERGDMRPLYVVHIAFSYADEAMEPPVPAGLQTSHFAIDKLCEYYEIDTDLLSVAAEASAPAVAASSKDEVVGRWLESLSKAELMEHLRKSLQQPQRYPAQILQHVRAAAPLKSTECTSGKRTLGELRARVNAIEIAREEAFQIAQAADAAKHKAIAEEAKQKRLAAIAKDPSRTFIRIDQAIALGNRPAYQRAAAELAQLAEAVGAASAHAKADEIRAKYPTRSALSSELKKVGF